MTETQICFLRSKHVHPNKQFEFEIKTFICYQDKSLAFLEYVKVDVILLKAKLPTFADEQYYITPMRIEK